MSIYLWATPDRATGNRIMVLATGTRYWEPDHGAGNRITGYLITVLATWSLYWRTGYIFMLLAALPGWLQQDDAMCCCDLLGFKISLCLFNQLSSRSQTYRSLWSRRSKLLMANTRLIFSLQYRQYFKTQRKLSNVYPRISFSRIVLICLYKAFELPPTLLSFRKEISICKQRTYYTKFKALIDNVQNFHHSEVLVNVRGGLRVWNTCYWNTGRMEGYSSKNNSINFWELRISIQLFFPKSWILSAVSFNSRLSQSVSWVKTSVRNFQLSYFGWKNIETRVKFWWI